MKDLHPDGASGAPDAVLHAPVLVAMDSDHVLGGVQELLAIVRPGPGAGGRVGVKLDPEIKTLPFFNIRLDRTSPSHHGKESLF